MLKFSALVLLAGQVFAQSALQEMPSAENNALRLYADVGRKVSLPMAGAKNAAPSGQWWTVRVYLQNRSSETITVLLGTAANVVTGAEDDQSVNVTYLLASNREELDGIAVKPPASDLRAVKLAPQEVAALPIAQVQLKSTAPVSIMRITYSVDDQLGKWFEAWTGELKLTLDRSKPPK